MRKPVELQEWELLDAICQRYSSLPSAVLAEDASLLMGLEIVALGRAD